MTFRHLRNFLVIALLAVAVAGCSSTGGKKGGGYYKDDGPDANPPSNLDAVPDAVPRVEPLAGGANRPYVVFGKRYVPDTSDRPFKQRGIASWYGKKFHGNSTSIGEPYDMYGMTAAHPTLPIPSYARVTSGINGRSVIVRVNDRGPFHEDRIMDLSYVAAYKLGILGPGSGEVTVERILPADIPRIIAAGSNTAASSDTITSMPVAAPAPVEPVPVPLAPAASTTEAALASLPGQPAGRSTPVAPVAAQAAPGSAMASGGVYLQLGAFSQSANAQSLAARANAALSAGGSPQATVEQSNNLYRVKIGPYADRNAAMTAVQSVADRTGILPSITTR
jgi:rare lipoprotein A